MYHQPLLANVELDGVDILASQKVLLQQVVENDNQCLPPQNLTTHEVLTEGSGYQRLQLFPGLSICCEVN